MKPFVIGTRVRIQDQTSKLWNKVGEVVGIGRHRDYHVKLPSGRIYWRNRRFLRQYYEPFEDEEDGESEDEERKKKPRGDDDEKEEERPEPEVRRSTRMKKKVVRFGVNSIKYFIK